MLPLTLIRRVLTPRGVCVAIAAASLLIAGGYVVAKVMGPKLRAVENRAELKADDAAGRALEAQGTQTVSAATAQAAQTAGDLRRDTLPLDAQAHADPGATAALPAGVLARLRGGDARLCGSGRVACR